MPTIKHHRKPSLPSRFEDLVRLMPPRAIADDVQHESTIEMIDCLMAIEKLTKGQALYLETLVQLAEAFEASHHAVEAPRGIAALRHLLEENAMNASDLARLLGVHVSMGSKILNRERALTVDHLKLLSARFHVRPETFME